MKTKMFFLLALLAILALNRVYAEPLEEEAVVVAQLLSKGEGSKYHWDHIKILETKRAPEGVKFPAVMAVAVLYSDESIPFNPIEIRLIPYTAGKYDLWKVKGIQSAKD